MVEKINILGPDLRARVGLRKKLGLAELGHVLRVHKIIGRSTDLALSVVETRGNHQTGVQSNRKNGSTEYTLPNCFLWKPRPL